MSGNGRDASHTALVTGASSGIGLELARLFAADAYSVVLVARSEHKLQALAQDLTRRHGVRCEVVVADLARRDGPAAVMQTIQSRGLRIDALVNNAGYGLFGPFSETDLATEIDMIQLNVATLTELTKRVLPGMLSRHDGIILNVASTAGFQPGPLMAVYYATKSYVSVVKTPPFP